MDLALTFLILLGISFFVAVPGVSTQATAPEDVASTAASSGIGRKRVHQESVKDSRQPSKLQEATNVNNKVKYDLSVESSDCINLSNQAFPDVVFDYSDYEQNDGNCGISVSGRLKRHAHFWREIGAPDFILETIENGYTIPFFDIPPVQCSHNNKSAIIHSEFVSEAISELINLGSIDICDRPPHVINPLTVSVQSNGKKRLILDLRLVNHFIRKQSVKYEDMRTALYFLREGGFMFKFDLKSGYHHVEIHPSHRKFLGFSWKFNGKLSYFTFNCLPFGLSSAPFIFTKVVRPLVKKWRSEGKNIVVFLDDGLGFADTKSEAKLASDSVRSDLIAAGFVPNVQKSVWTPTVSLEWLGYDILLQSGLFRVPERRIQGIYQGIHEILESKSKLGDVRVKARTLASVAGKIVSTSLAVGSISKLMTKAMHICVESRYSWDSLVNLSDQALEELDFWLNNISTLNSAKVGPKPSASRIVYSDASSTGYGGYVVDVSDEISHGQWRDDESSKSSTWRELKAVEMVMYSFEKKLSGHRVKWFTDNQAVARITTHGSMKIELQRIALDIFSFCVRHNISLEVEWVPRTQNERADFISRIVDHDDWSIADSVFEYFDMLWGPHSIDRFASFYNTKLPRFNSRFWNPGCEIIDAFTSDWSGENNWLVPPIHLIPRVIFHMMQSRASGTLICPQWFSAPFWPILFPDGKTPIDGVVDLEEIQIFPGLFVRGRGDNDHFVNQIVRSTILAIRLQF